MTCFSVQRPVSLKTSFSTLTSHLSWFVSLPYSHQPLFPLVSLILHLLPDSMLNDSYFPLPVLVCPFQSNQYFILAQDFCMGELPPLPPLGSSKGATAAKEGEAPRFIKQKQNRPGDPNIKSKFQHQSLTNSSTEVPALI